MYKRANRVSLVDQVISQMEKLIENGHWPVGHKIPPEMLLMEEFDVSRNTLREAVQALVHAGLLESKQGSGTVVRSTSVFEAAMQRQIEKTGLIETLEVRLALEKEAAQLAAKRRNEEDIAGLRAYIDKCRDAAERRKLEDFIAADIKFHQAIFQAAKNSLLEDLYEHMTKPLYSSIKDLMAMDPQFCFEEEIHDELFRAICDQDVEAAVNEVNEYIAQFKKRLT
ncbi:GntR family transcriptional regulator [Siminovitchia terrae]|uniref:GntR family transcriptional regulator n=1 Tax=Siminovitchia terrae TaxID=1914933 RepID=A0ABQ4KWK7_SIMTE|nr:FadR/GntR family transcriptional regulator [Siminovitchia terrae]GIN96422.1 GntR family transcriptional regulator [Siminovitchia terrae]